MQQLNRIQPQGPVQAYKTYQLLQPLDTHFRVATCAEVDCPAYLFGWKTVIDESTELGQQQAYYIRDESGRRYTRDPVVFGRGPVAYFFEAGQQCFRQHREPLEREPLAIVKDGDWRMSQNPRHLRTDDWVDDFANHQDKLNTQRERG